jgi:hypothetical protein
VTLTATVAPSGATGDVNFFDGPNHIGTVALVNGVATLSVTNFTVGSHTLVARYKGDACYAPSESAPVEQVVNPATTTTTLASDPNPSGCGVKVTFTATVAPAGATGEVNFFDGPNPIGSGTLVNGVATLSIATLALGPHSVTAVYKGDACYASSTSNKVEQVVVPVATTTTLTSSPNPSTCRDDKVEVIATVSPATATGTVNFFDAGVPIGSATVVNGVATLSVTTFMNGTHPLTAVYKGDPCHAPSTGTHDHERDCPVPSLLTLFKAEPIAGAIELRWQFGDPGFFVETRVDRSTDKAGPWTTVDAEVRDEAGVRVIVDRSVTAGTNYWYRLVARPQSGAPAVFGPLSATAGAVIERFELARVWPNPSAGNTRIDYAVARATNVRLSVLDVQGREVAVLAQGSHGPGKYHANWTGETAKGAAPVGIYFVRYEALGKVHFARLVIAR